MPAPIPKRFTEHAPDVGGTVLMSVEEGRVEAEAGFDGAIRCEHGLRWRAGHLHGTARMPALINLAVTVPRGSDRRVSGTDVHRLACYLMEQPGVGAHERQVKDFAVWPPVFVGSDASGADLLELRLAWLAHERFDRARLLRRLGERPNLGLDVPIAVESHSITESTFAGFVTQPGSPSQKVMFLTPTTFSRNGRDYPFPDPVLLHQRLIARWNDHAGAVPQFAIADQVARSICSKVVVTAHSIQTAVVEAPVPRTGFVGSVEFALRGRSSGDELRVFAALWRFAEFSGVGSGTTYGLGAIELVTDSGPADEIGVV